jgi:hypothetical protein
MKTFPFDKTQHGHGAYCVIGLSHCQRWKGRKLTNKASLGTIVTGLEEDESGKQDRP